MGHPDYPLQEFANRLANVEEKYAKEIQELVECFSGSRVDLPVKRLEDLAKVRNRTAKYLRKVNEHNKDELCALWKLCNVYSVMAVDVDKAMRETRGSLRKKIKPTTKEPSTFRRLVDEYRPIHNKQSREPPQDIYDSNKPIVKDKRFLDIFKKKDSRKMTAPSPVDQSYTPTVISDVKLNFRPEHKLNVLPPKPPPITSMTTPPEPSYNPPSYPTERNPTSQTVFTVSGTDYAPAVKIRTVATKEKIEDLKRLSMPVTLDVESAELRKIQLPPVAPPRKDKLAENPMATAKVAPMPSEITKDTTLNTAQRQIKRASPALPPRPKEDVWKKNDLTKVSPTVIQLDGRFPPTSPGPQIPENPPQIAHKRVENATNIQVEDMTQRVLSSPQTTIQIGVTESSGMAIAMSPKVSNGRVQRLQPESLPPRPVQQAQIVNLSEPLNRQTSVDRF